MFTRWSMILVVVVAAMLSPIVGQAADSKPVTMYRMLEALSDSLRMECFNLEHTGQPADSINAHSLKIFQLAVDRERWHQASLMSEGEFRQTFPSDSGLLVNGYAEGLKLVHQFMQEFNDLLAMRLSMDSQASYEATY